MGGLGTIGGWGMGDAPLSVTTTVPTPEQALAIQQATIDNLTAGIAYRDALIADAPAPTIASVASSLFGGSSTMTATQQQQITWIAVAALGLLVVMSMSGGGTGGRRR